MQDDFEYDAHTYEAPKRARWYTRLLPACLRHGCLSNKRQAFPLYLIGYDPVGQLQRAASVGDVASVERFINLHGCHVNEYDRRDRTSLHYACAHNHPDVVRLLLSYSANINIADDEGCTPLIKATQRDNVECVSILLTQGADPHVNDLSGHTALHHAVCRGNTTIVSKLLEYNVDIEGKTEYGLTPYKLALYENQQEMAEFLLKNGANVHSVVNSKSVGTSTEDLEQRTKEHERLNNEGHCSTDPTAFGSTVMPPTQVKSILKKSVHLTTARRRMKHKISLCVRSSSKRQEQRNKKRVRFNNEVYYCPEPMPFCSLYEEENTPPGSIKEDKESPSIIKDYIETPSSSYTKTLKQTSHLDKMDRIKKTGMTVWKSDMNLCAQREAIPERSEKKTFIMVEEKKAEHFSNNPDDRDLAVPQPTAHSGPASSSGTGDSVDIVEAPKNQDLGAVHSTALDLKLPLGDAQDADIIFDAENLADNTHYTSNNHNVSVTLLSASMPLLLITSLMWFLKFFFLMLMWILQPIQHMLGNEDYQGAPSNEKADQVAAEDN